MTTISKSSRPSSSANSTQRAPAPASSTKAPSSAKTEPAATPAPRAADPTRTADARRGSALRDAAAQQALQSRIPSTTSPATATPTGTATAATGGGTGTSGVAGCPVVDGAHLAEMTQQLATQVKDMSGRQHMDAAQITATTYANAAALVEKNYPNLPAKDRSDMAVAMSFYALNGPGQVDNLSKVDSGQTKVVPYLKDIAANDPKGQGFAGDNLDHTGGAGTFDPRMSDHTENQSFHTNFFIAAGYVAGSNPVSQGVANAANVVHETLDPNAWVQGGGTVQDWRASTAGQLGGSTMNALRDNPAAMGAFVSGLMSSPGTPPPAMPGVTSKEAERLAALGQGIKEAAMGLTANGMGGMAGATTVGQALTILGHVVHGEPVTQADLRNLSEQSNLAGTGSITQVWEQLRAMVGAGQAVARYLANP